MMKCAAQATWRNAVKLLKILPLQRQLVEWTKEASNLNAMFEHVAMSVEASFAPGRRHQTSTAARDLGVELKASFAPGGNFASIVWQDLRCPVVDPPSLLRSALRMAPTSKCMLEIIDSVRRSPGAEMCQELGVVHANAFFCAVRHLETKCTTGGNAVNLPKTLVLELVEWTKLASNRT
jgi:hypothetical protein